MSKNRPMASDFLESISSASPADPCGCGQPSGTAGESERQMGGSALSPAEVTGEVDAALAALSSGLDEGAALTELLNLDVDLEFAELSAGAEITLEDVIRLAERYPGLKVTFSF